MFTAVAALALTIQLLYLNALRGGFTRARHHFGQLPATPAVPATVVVAARNEEADLPRLLAALKRQDHPELDVVIVDDASTDATAELVRRFGHPSLRLVEVTAPEAPRKKNALTAGIAAAANDVLLLTDADCEPPRSWASRISALHRPGTQRVVVGYSPFRRTRGFINAFARYETFIVGYAAAAAIGAGKPYMAVGRNISYRRTTFESASGFDHARDSISGDDDLLVQHLATNADVEFVHAFGDATYVVAEGPTTWREWISQKLRHVSAGRWYTASVKRHLALYHASATLVWLAPLYAGEFGLGALAIRALWQYWSLRGAAEELGETDLLIGQPVYEFLYFVYNLVVAPMGVMSKRRIW